MKLESIEALRAFAATMILIFHVVGISNIAFAVPLTFIRTHFGLGVPLFYVLSGFVLAYGYCDALTDRTSILRFYVRRLFRIAPLFYAVLFITALRKLVNGTLSLPEILLNMTFTFGLVPGKHESIVMAGWSIGVEMIFYLIFPLVAMLIAGVRSGMVAWVIALLVSVVARQEFTQAGLGTFAYLNLLTHLPYFVAGILAYRIWELFRFQQSARIGWLLLLGAVALGFAGIWSMALMLVVLSVGCWPNGLLVNRISVSLGKISFSLYLLHPIAILLLKHAGVYDHVADRFGAGYAGLFVCIMVTASVLIPTSLLSFKFIEKPGMSLGKRLARKIGEPGISPVPVGR